MNNNYWTASVAALAVSIAAPASASAQERMFAFDVPAQDLGGAIRAFAKATRSQVSFNGDDVRGKRSNALKGSYSATAALQQIIAGTGVDFRQAQPGLFVVTRSAVGNVGVTADRQTVASSGDDAAPEGQEGISEILVVGSRSQNVDIRRTEDDPQPYVVFGTEEIERSGASSLEDFLKTRLSANTQNDSVSQTSNSQAFASLNEGLINLRGLGTDETLILLDGRRLPNTGIFTDAASGQPAVSGIALSSVERIEVLPATSGGIYGGSATGGVVNIILKRNYSGLDVEGSVGDTLSGGAGQRSLSFALGFSIENGKTRVRLSGSYRNQSELLDTDRNFAKRANERYLRNAVGFISPSGGSLPNVCSAVFRTNLCSSNAPDLVLDPIYGGTSSGSPYTFIPEGYGGPQTDNANALLVNAGNFDYHGQGLQLLPKSKSIYIDAGLDREFGSRLKGYISGTYSKILDTTQTPSAYSFFLAADHPNNPYQQDVAVFGTVPGLTSSGERKLKTASVNAGLILKLPLKWSANLEGAYTSSTNSTGYSPYIFPFLSSAGTAYFQGLGLVNPGEEIDQSVFDSGTLIYGPRGTESRQLSLRVSGPTFSTSAGPMNVTALLERRREKIGQGFIESFGDTYWAPSKGTAITSGYLEARIPLLSNRSRSGHALDILASARWDKYDVDSSPAFYFVESKEGPFPEISTQHSAYSALSYTVAAKYEPVDGLSLRTSYGTGFLPPNSGQLSSLQQPLGPFFRIQDPRRGDTFLGTDVINASGGNPDVVPEKSASWALGLILKPSFAPGWRFSVDRVSTTKKNEIYSPSIDYVLANEAVLPGRVVRSAPLPGDAPDWAGPVISVDNTMLNLSYLKSIAYDFKLDGVAKTSFGEFRPYLLVTYQSTLSRKARPEDRLVNYVDYNDGPLRYKAAIGASWSKGNWQLNWDSQFFYSYNIIGSTASPLQAQRIVTEQGGRRVRSQVYSDVSIFYLFKAKENRSVLNDVRIALSVQNVLNAQPPIISSNIGTGGYSHYGDPRLRRFRLTLRKHF